MNSTANMLKMNRKVIKMRRTIRMIKIKTKWSPAEELIWEDKQESKERAEDERKKNEIKKG